MAAGSPDFYGVLNVPRDATRADIRRAYRQRARSAHPDGGGDKGEFALIKLAHDVLTDETRRERYDRTGEFQEQVIDNRMAEVMGLIAGHLDRALGRMNCDIATVLTLDLVERIRLELEDSEKPLIAERDRVAKAIDLHEKISFRFETEKDDDPIGRLMTARSAALKAAQEMNAEKLKRFAEAKAILADYRFRAEKATIQLYNHIIEPAKNVFIRVKMP